MNKDGMMVFLLRMMKEDEDEQSHLRTRDARALRDDNMLDRTRVGLRHFAENQEVNFYAVSDLETDNNFHISERS